MASSTGDHRNERPQKRSRSSYDQNRPEDLKRQRSRSPHRHHHHHRSSKPSRSGRLPFNARSLHRGQFEDFKPIFAEYLDLQKQLDIGALSEGEVKGRWKSFLGKWNRGELAEGWYDPETKSKVDARFASRGAPVPVQQIAAPPERPIQPESEEDEEDEYGPALPDTASRHAGPAVPSMQDLQHRQELTEEDRHAHIADLRHERKLDRKSQKERLEELAPRAEPGSRERQLEKKQEKSSANRAFRDAKDAGGMEEVGDNELMGGGEDEYKAKLKARERQKNEREIKKEEMLRARAAEREEKVAEHRRKEEKTMDMLRELARQRYG